ncbi:tRNA preQ1(34) S-adenosylmethionine ribosyltransferase-isomerase QueA [Candidatus Saccharibacteria bacterium]|nr:tRNA preQ1(34) S-adenosylmethionine ribosyltransferase-isomerase QueA [Candidatus Saccharibacteria bacterium]
MKPSDFSYNLPENLIAKHPPRTRGTSRLLVLDRRTGRVQDSHYANLAEFLDPGDLLIINDTKVMKSRLIATKKNGAKRELVVLEKHLADTNWHQHQVLYRGRLQTGEELFIDQHKLEVVDILGNGLAIIRSKSDLLELTNEYGTPPLPPYLKRDATPSDTERYQTVFARNLGSAAAPTASLNMTDSLLEKLRAKKIKITSLTLRVGLGTFLPIRVDDIRKHRMHAEYFVLPTQTLTAIRHAKQSGYRVIALGTTVARTLEYCAKTINAQATPSEVRGEADIFIYPGYNFKIVDGLLTNFHAPNSTVLMLAAAFAGWDNLSAAYEHAKSDSYKFLSYGDSMLIL